MHLCYSASQIIKVIIFVDLSAILLAPPLSILAWEFSKWHAFPASLLSRFQWPNQFAALLVQSDKTFQYHKDYRMLRSFVRTPFKFHKLIVWLSVAPQNFDDPVYLENQIFLEGRFFPRLIRPPGNVPSKLSLVSTWHITNV